MGTIQDQVSGVFTSVGNDLKSILIAIAVIVLPVFIALLAYKYGRKIFYRLVIIKDNWQYRRDVLRDRH